MAELTTTERSAGAGEKPRQRSTWRWLAPVLASALSFAIAAGIVAVMVAVGLGNAYSVEVVDVEARAATHYSEYTGISFLETHDQLCGDGEDFELCVEKHEVMYESLCTETTLTEYGEWVCTDLGDWVTAAQADVEDCAGDCVTDASADGEWGWAQLWPSEEYHAVVLDDAQEAVTHVEHCYFQLGPFTLGNCTA